MKQGTTSCPRLRRDCLAAACAHKRGDRAADLRLAPGARTLTVHALDPGVILDRFEVAFTGAARAYGPVPETKIVQ